MWSPTDYSGDYFGDLYGYMLCFSRDFAAGKCIFENKNVASLEVGSPVKKEADFLLVEPYKGIT